METETAETRFRRAFASHFDAVNRYCLRRISLDEVNDVVAEVFAVAWRKVDRMPEAEDVLPWLYGVARNEISNRRRSVRRFRALNTKVASQAWEPDRGPEPIVIRNAELQELMNSLASLSRADQEILLLRTHEEFDYTQMAVALGCSPEAARKRLSRAVSRLRRASGHVKAQPAPSLRAMEGGDH